MEERQAGHEALMIDSLVMFSQGAGAFGRLHAWLHFLSTFVI